MAALRLMVSESGSTGPNEKRARQSEFANLAEQHFTSDHDILVRQTTLLEVLLGNVKDLRDEQRLTQREVDARIDKCIDEFNKRLTPLEQMSNKLIGAALLAGAVSAWIFRLIFH